MRCTHGDTQTTLTNIFTGLPARAIINLAIKELGPISQNVPNFPLAPTALGPLRLKAEAAGSSTAVKDVARMLPEERLGASPRGAIRDAGRS
jgi:hypothetical protein